MKAFKITLRVIAIILVSVAVLFLAVNGVIHLVYFDFFKNSDRVGEVAGLSDGFIPQGIDLTDEFIMSSGYMKDGSASRIYLSPIDKDSKAEPKYTELLMEDGTPYTRHAGGVTHVGDYVYVAGSSNKTFDVFSLKDVLSKDSARLLGTVKAYTSPAWVTVSGEYIFAGSFAMSDGDSYKPKKGETVTTPSGDKNISVINVFKLDTESPFGIDPTPVATISSGEKIQGAAFLEDGRVITSTSYGLSTSVLYFHKLNTAVTGTHTLGKTDDSDGYTVPLLYLDSSTLCSELKAIPMAEEVIVSGGRVYVMNESASAKYFFGNLIGGRGLYAYELSDERFN